MGSSGCWVPSCFALARGAIQVWRSLACSYARGAGVLLPDIDSIHFVRLMIPSSSENAPKRP